MPRIRLGAMLGLDDGGDASTWGRLRAIQLDALGRRAALLFGLHVVAVMLTLPAFVPWQRVLWASTVLAGTGAVAWRRRRMSDRIENEASRRDIAGAVIDSLAIALLWTFPFLAAARGHVLPASPDLWLAGLALTLGSALILAPVPLAGVTFVVVVAAAMALALLTAQMHLAAAATVMVAGLLTYLTLALGHALVARHLTQAALDERNETVSLLLRDFDEQGSDWLWEIDAARRIVHASERFAAACRLPAETMTNLPFLQVLAGPTWEAGNFAAGLRQLAEKLKQREGFRDLTLPIVLDGEERWWEIAARPRYDANGVFLGFRGVASDVTEQRASADKINRMARFDTLTGLPNRLHVNEALSRALTDAERWRSRCAFMMIDLDRFKAVNDTLGHPIGDRLLGRVSERLSQMMSENELIGRLGGDEFAVVVRDASDPQRVERLARTIIDTLSRPYEVDQHTLLIGASVGVATSPRDGRTAETLIRSADLALYRSKDRGGGVFHAYEPQLHADAEERRVLELELRQALERGELALHYQPVVDAGSGNLRGFEALLRWNHPRLGPIGPNRFVGIAEETRLISPIGEWVARTACEEAARWPGDLRVAVNVSPEQLTNPNFVTVIASALAQSRLPAQRLELEVTEGVFMREGTGATRVLEQVLDLGVRLSLDDFGTGFSSLGYLSRTRFSSIKIDRSFVVSAAQGVAEPLAIIRAVVALARSLGMMTTAEGVETEAELALVRELGCTAIQGYYFGRPLPVDDTRDLIRRNLGKARAA
ncbi:EAL domain-containing protein [Sphingomonas sp. RHCKR47]|nr:EAL domain-containing protein [Sphingomonas citricola]